MDLIGQNVKVKLKWGMEYVGTLHSADAYMNVLLHQCDEYIEQQFAGHLGTVLIRCNNVLYIVAVPLDDDDGDDHQADAKITSASSNNNTTTSTTEHATAISKPVEQEMMEMSER
jgi:small nuclear ribonucleoprotein F